MKQKINLLRTRPLLLFFSLCLGLFLVVGVIFFWQISDKTEKTLTEQVKQEQLIIARATATAISEFFEARKIRLMLLAEVEPVKAGKEKEGREVMKFLFEQLKRGVLASIGRVDKEGKLIWVVNKDDNREEEGSLLTDQDYFIWAKQQKAAGEIFLTNPIVSRAGVTKDKWTVLMATPVFYQGKFNGLVTFLFPIEEIAKKFIEPMIAVPNTELFMITQDKVVVYSTISEALGKDSFQVFEKYSWSGREKTMAMIREAVEGKENWGVNNLVVPGTGRELTTITVYTPIILSNQRWTFLISVPYQKVIEIANLLRLTNLEQLLFFIIGVLIIVILVILRIRMAQKEAFINGFKDGRNGVKHPVGKS